MSSLNILSAYLLDLILGDPEWFPHPVRGMGKLINLLEKRLNVKSAHWASRINGAMLTLVVVGVSTSFAYLFIEFFKGLNPLLGNLAWIYLGYTSLSIKDLQLKAKAISETLTKGRIFEARRELSKIVGRDTRNLSEGGITQAAIESVAENTNDGIVAPLFYLILGGPVLALAYKSINTLDSMVGYKDERHLYFGWFSAKLDDAVNFIPARITGILIGIASTESFKIMLRDGRKHPSPNSGITEAAMAGALGIRLGGPSQYAGKLFLKPYLGESKREIKPALIKEALKISFVVSFFTVTIGMVLKWVI